MSCDFNVAFVATEKRIAASKSDRYNIPVGVVVTASSQRVHIQTEDLNPKDASLVHQPKYSAPCWAKIRCMASVPCSDAAWIASMSFAVRGVITSKYRAGT